MSSRRLLKAANAIRQVVSMAILAELKDPRVRDVTVTGVEVSPDMRSAVVKVSVMGEPSKQQLALHGLRSAAGFLQAKITQRIDTRYTPRLSFELDLGVKRSIAIAKTLREVLPAPASPSAEPALDADEFDDVELADAEESASDALSPDEPAPDVQEAERDATDRD
jgi:ribosome-binding factor A